MNIELINQLRDNYILDRVQSVDPDFLAFEEEMSSQEDLVLILEVIQKGLDLPNPHNSILLYITGISNEFDHNKARADTINGSPPDVDVDFDALKRYEMIEWVAETWGTDNTAQIGTYTIFKPRGMIDTWHKVWEKPLGNIKKYIPDDKHGKTATLDRVVETHPEFPTLFPDFYQDAKQLEGMINQEGIHAAGVVIADFPIKEAIPIRLKKDKADKYHTKKVEKRVTQYDMKEVEELGLLKFDFLGVENLSIIDETCRLISQQHGINIDLNTIPDHDEKAYSMIESGLVTGVFQMEKSSSAKDLIQRIKPRSISELSDINALNRPGPLQGGLHDVYVENKNNGYPPGDLPPQVADIFKTSYWTLCYQEQVMKLASQLAGFTEQEADDVRRAMGKKKKEVLEKWQKRFVDGCVNVGGLDQDYAGKLWILLAGDPDNPDNSGFADYCLAGNTVIQTAVGDYTIEEIVNKKFRPYVPSVTKEGAIVQEPITQHHKRGNRKCVSYVFEDGSEITCTPNHRFLTKTGDWISIQDACDKGIELQTV